MNKIIWGLLYIMIWFPIDRVFAQEMQTKDTLFFVDGPYILHEKDGGVRLLEVDETGKLTNRLFFPDDHFSFQVRSEDGAHRFSVRLHRFSREEYRIPEVADQIFVISDPHGNMDCFVSILQAGKVIDEAYRWVFGRNRVVIIGDVFDRGEDVLPIFWLIYKLEQEAREAGGAVTFLLGNHEEMVLRGDLRYTREKYLNMAKRLGLSYQELWHGNSELGRWLQTKNTVAIVGDDVFVHAGFSREFAALKESLEEVNRTVSASLFLSKPERKAVSGLSAFLFSGKGPLWYRGMVLNKKKYDPMTLKEVKSVMQKLKVEKVWVGHTIFKDISRFYGKRVIAVNVNNVRNRNARRGRGVMMKKGKLYRVYDSGKWKEMR
ncbi:metallophosphoesterase [Gabonibacter chumensis]|uniref:metallophosphoesterase n=1 Tax=Gabonibacter chumensis TaxID=2972474 RepID=UPI0025741C41|nr:metallophosphoesterase [Gabonibacter chumensis]MCR9013131.1 metallophosphoesterase [Gabonibacter chumensis]